MTSTSQQPSLGVEDLSTAGLLAAAKAERAAADAAEARVLAIAVAWADAHPAETVDDGAVLWAPGCEEPVAIAGQGCPLVAEFAIAELGSVLGASTVAAKHLVGQALELRHRLPRLWRAVHAGKVPAWRARKVAERTIHAWPALTPAAAAWVDDRIAAFAGRCSLAQVDRLVEEAIRRHDLAPKPGEPGGPSDPDPDAPTRDRRHVTVLTDEVGHDGTVDLIATLDLADGHDLHAAVAHGAATLKALGSVEGLDGRRASALGDLARRQLSLDLATQTGQRTNSTSADSAAERADQLDATLPKARQVVLHVHAHAAFGPLPPGFETAAGGLLNHRSTAGVVTGGIGIGWDPLARLEEGHRILLLDQVKDWCRDTHTKVVIQPVVDTAATLTAPGYRIPDRLRTQVVLRDQRRVQGSDATPSLRSCDEEDLQAGHAPPPRAPVLARDPSWLERR